VNAAAAAPTEGPLSFEQERLWLWAQFNPGDPSFNRPFALRFQGTVDEDRVEAALAACAARHDALRVRIRSRPTPHQIVSAEPPPRAARHRCDLRGEEFERWWRSGAAEVARAPFDWADGVVRAAWFRGEEEAVLVLVIHHVAFDGVSEAIVFDEIVAGLEGRTLPPARFSFVAWAERARREIDEAGVLFFHKRMEGIVARGGGRSLLLDGKPPRTTKRSYEGVRASHGSNAAIGDAVRAFARAERVSPFAVLLAAFQALHAAWGDGRADVVVGATVQNRSAPGSEAGVGCFASVLPWRGFVPPGATFRDVVREARAHVFSTLSHQGVPFQRILAPLRLPRNVGHAPLYQSMMVLRPERRLVVSWSGGTITREEVDSGTAKFDLQLDLRPEAGGWAGFCEAPSDLYDQAFAGAFARAYWDLVARVVAAPDTSVLVPIGRTSGRG
jgi:hypothetical protein